MSRAQDCILQHPIWKILLFHLPIIMAFFGLDSVWKGNIEIFRDIGAAHVASDDLLLQPAMRYNMSKHYVVECLNEVRSIMSSSTRKTAQSQIVRVSRQHTFRGRHHS